MFSLLQRTHPTKRALAMLLSIALLLWTVGVHIQTAEAASITNVKNTLSDSDLSALADHEIEYVIPSASAGVESGESIVVTFPSQFTGTSSVTLSDVDLEVDGTDETLVSGAPAANQWQFTWVGNDITFLSGGGTAVIGALATVTIKIGSNADGGTTRVINPSSASSYQFDIISGDGANNDSGATQVAIIDNVVVTAAVDTSFTFTITGLPIGTSVNGSATTTGTTTTSTSIPFGTLVSNSSETAAQRLNVTTNARNGYIVTVEQDQNLLSSTGADIDGFIDGAYTDSPSAWVSPSNSLLNENTWGHWGLTTTDGNLQGAGTDFTSADTWIAASTTPRVIMAHNAPSDGSTGTALSTSDDVGSTTVGYQIEITPLQEAGDDYTTTLTYIATPTF